MFIAAIIVVWLIPAAPVTASPQFERDCLALTSSPHRLSGSAEAAAAAAHLQRRFEQIGVDEVVVEPFETAQTKVLRCEVIVQGRASEAPNPLVLQPMRPNGIMCPVTPPGGITGPFYHAGLGLGEDYEARTPRGSIVVLDYNAGRSWMRAFRLGARAVIFVSRGEHETRRSHQLEANANFPRFYYEGDPADLPDGQTATIHSRIVWQRATGQNVVAVIRGSDAKFDLERDEAIVVSANLDSYGQVPRRSPGAAGAVNAAGLLKVAEHLVRHRPRRHVVLAVMDGHARGMLGAHAFYRAVHAGSGLAARQKSLAEETAFLLQLSDQLAIDEPMAESSSPARTALRRRLRDFADEYTAAVNEQLYELRRTLSDPSLDDAKRALAEQTKADLDIEKERWNDLRRAIGRNRMQSAPPQPLAHGLDEIRRHVAARQRELEAHRRELDAEQQLKTLTDGWLMSLHASMLLGDASSQWGLAIGGHAAVRNHSDNPGLYSKVQTTFQNSFDTLTESGADVSGFMPGSVDGTLSPPHAIWSSPVLVHSGEVAGILGIYNVVMCAAMESQRRVGTPDDRLDLLDLGRIERHIDQVALMLGDVAGQRALSQISSIDSKPVLYVHPSFSGERPKGAAAMARIGGAGIARPLAGAVVMLRRHGVGAAFNPRKALAYDQYQVVMTDGNGSYRFGPGINGMPWSFAAYFDEHGQVVFASDETSRTTVKDRMNLRRCVHGGLILPPHSAISAGTLMNAETDGPVSKDKSFFEAADGSLLWFCDDKYELIKLFGLNSIVTLVNGPELLAAPGASEPAGPGDFKGKGIASSGSEIDLRVTDQSAGDLWRLNESRIDVLRDKAIMNSSVEELHGRAEDLLIEAAAEASPVRRDALAASAFLAASAVYNRVRSSLDDLVHAVLVLLALSVPFAFALERLLIGSVIIYRQIAGFAVIFGSTFIVLYLTHPAFAVSNTPAIIFLGFAILLLSVMVIFIIMRKFEVELKVLRGLTSTVHATDVSRLGTILAAVSMGISTMRRRPMRTALTATTIILLTFTILCFASFDTRTGIVRLFVTPPPGYTAVFYHRVNWEPISEDLLDIFENRWRGQGDVKLRYWVCPRSASYGVLLAAREDAENGDAIVVRGALGLDRRELEHRADLRRLLGGEDLDLTDGICMTHDLARRLKVAVGDRVMLAGRRLQVRALIDAAAFSIAKDLDDSDILPADFMDISNVQMQARVAQQAGENDELSQLGASQNWVSLLADSVVVVSNETARELGGDLEGVTFYVRDADVAGEIAADIARMLRQPVAATLQDGVYRHVLGAIVQASNVQDLFFPLLLGGLVVFGTMLGSVTDREKEIYSFSALGLAPTHVAGLFFAEAMVFSIIGGLGGYLLAQATMKVFGFFAQFGLVRMPEMNYSSTNAIVTILIVMATVLVSAIYPAVKASRSANPGVMRTWRMPPPAGDTFHITFPFTVSQYDFTGIVSFLKEHFDNYTDTGLGVFMAKEARLIRRDDDQVGIAAELALAPFDLGVTQSFNLQSAASEIAGIDEVVIEITRRSGQPKDWQRLNKVLLNDLRKQFLIWRSIPHDTMEVYRQRTLTDLGKRG